MVKLEVCWLCEEFSFDGDDFPYCKLSSEIDLYIDDFPVTEKIHPNCPKKNKEK